MADSSKPAPAELFLQHLDQIFRQEPLFFKEPGNIAGYPGVTAIVYKDVPEKGYITGLTYGLSLVPHPDWKLGRPELCITVESENLSWARVAAFLANHLRGKCPFSYGQTINFREKISEDTEMDAFFIFAPGILDKEDYLDIDIGTDYKINIAGLYPMYSEELALYNNIGLQQFWHHPGFDLYDINRKRISEDE